MAATALKSFGRDATRSDGPLSAGLNGMCAFGDFDEFTNNCSSTAMNFCGRGDGVEIGGEETRKGGNMTERVQVPSSEHVAEIVGRQGRSHDIEY